MGQGSTVDRYLSLFCTRDANEVRSSEFDFDDSDNVAFLRDDADEFQNSRTEQQRAHLGSFINLPNQANRKTQFISMNPIILLYRPDGQNLGLWVTRTSSEAAENSESE
jgi:hypothetical protein